MHFQVCLGVRWMRLLPLLIYGGRVLSQIFAESGKPASGTLILVIYYRLVGAQQILVFATINSKVIELFHGGWRKNARMPHHLHAWEFLHAEDNSCSGFLYHQPWLLFSGQRNLALMTGTGFERSRFAEADAFSHRMIGSMNSLRVTRAKQTDVQPQLSSLIRFCLARLCSTK